MKGSGVTSKKASQAPPPVEEVEVDGVLDVDPDQEVIEGAYAITSYGADFLVDGLVGRMKSGDILVPAFDPEVDTKSEIAGFQRGFVWTKPQIDRFIESLLLGFPVPGIFLVRDIDEVFLVLDGQQRLRSLQAFNEGTLRERTFRLEYVEKPYKGLKYSELDDNDRRRLDSSIIHATIVRQDNPPNDYGSVYSIFERLNTGGTPLQPQEIRVALFRGEFINLLRELNSFEPWREIYGARSDRLKDQELLVRYFAFYYRREKFERPVKGFLNDFLEANRHLELYSGEELSGVFRATASVLAEAVGRQAFRPQRSLNAAVFDSVMVGLADRLQQGHIEDSQGVRRAYEKLLANSSYKVVTESSTASEESVKKRMTLAVKAFSKVR
jgi:hypothetical protein